MKHPFTFVFTLGLAASLWAGATRTSTLAQVPGADILPHGMFQVQAAGGYFQLDTTTTDTAVPKTRSDFGIRGRVKIGLFDQFEGSFQGAMNTGRVTGRYAAFSLKGLIFEEKGWFRPNLAFGVDNVFSNADGGFYRAPGPDTLERMVNTAYLTATKTISRIKARTTAGVACTPTFVPDRVAPFAAWEQYFGAGMYLDLEVYKKMGLYQTALTGGWCGSRGAVSFGVTNVHQLLGSGGPAASGYQALGVILNVSGFFQVGREREKPETACQDSLAGLQVQLLKTRNELQEAVKAKNFLEAQRAELAKAPAAPDTAPPSFDPRTIPALVENYLKDLETARQSPSFDAGAMADLMKKITQYSEYSLPVLEKAIKTPQTPPATLSQAITMVGQIGNKNSKDMLVELLGRKESACKIDAMIALGKLRDRSVIQYITGAMQDTDPMVVETARLVLESFGVSTGETPAAADTSRTKPAPKPDLGKTKNGKR
jgi:hypothetical protein